MFFLERSYRTLIVSPSDKFNAFIAPYLTTLQSETVVHADSINSARRQLLENSFDFVIINSMPPEEPGIKLAIDISTNKNTVCLLIVKAELHDEIHSKVAPHGVFTLAKPTPNVAMQYALDFLFTARERLRSLEKKAMSIEDKMEEIRVVNRAKWLLIEQQGMSETEAHRHIEKTAMDMCISKIAVAKDIIQKYS
ncbi:MAG: ANTAR domain-containing protein [Lachnospiraceae bacterium]|nr:ANTAR domain-containing protein [Lachnospiraceae bacterium]